MRGLAVSVQYVQLPKAIDSAHSNVHTPAPLSPRPAPPVPAPRKAPPRATGKTGKNRSETRSGSSLVASHLPPRRDPLSPS